MLRGTARHSQTNSASVIGLRRPSAFGTILGRGKVPYVYTLRPSSKIGPSILVFQQASGYPDQAYPDPRCAFVECRPVYGPSAFGLPRTIWRGIVEAPAEVPLAEKVQPIGKGSKGRRTQGMPPLYPLRTASLKARFPPKHSP